MYYINWFKQLVERNTANLMVSVILHLVLLLIMIRTHYFEAAADIPSVQNMTVQINPYSSDLTPFTSNPEKPESQPAVKNNAVKAGVIPSKVKTPESGKKGGSVMGFHGEGGEEAIGTKGVGEGPGSSGEGGNGQPGSDIYRVGVEEMPEPFGGIDGILAKIPQSIPDYAASRGRSIYIWAFIDESGIVRKVQISKGLGNALDAQVAAAVKRTRFRPGKDKRKIVKVQMMLNVPIM